MFNEGKLVQSVIHKTTDLYASEDAYDPTSGRRTFAEYFFRNDTLVSRTRYDYTNGIPTTATSTFSAVIDAQKSSRINGPALGRHTTV